MKAPSLPPLRFARAVWSHRGAQVAWAQVAGAKGARAESGAKGGREARGTRLGRGSQGHRFKGRFKVAERGSGWICPSCDEPNKGERLVCNSYSEALGASWGEHAGS